jgi:hypothetical protein
MTGKYMGTPVGVLLRDDQFYEREGDGWVAKPVTDALKPLLGESITDANVKYTLEWMQNPVGTTYNRFYSFPLLRSQDYDITRGVFVLGEETLHNTQVTSYELPSCVNCFGDMPRYYMASAWIDPVTKHVHKYKVAPPGFHGATITISRHDDPSLELPTP